MSKLTTRNYLQNLKSGVNQISRSDLVRCRKLRAKNHRLTRLRNERAATVGPARPVGPVEPVGVVRPGTLQVRDRVVDAADGRPGRAGDLEFDAGLARWRTYRVAAGE